MIKCGSFSKNLQFKVKGCFLNVKNCGMVSSLISFKENLKFVKTIVQKSSVSVDDMFFLQKISHFWVFTQKTVFLSNSVGFL